MIDDPKHTFATFAEAVLELLHDADLAYAGRIGGHWPTVTALIPSV